MRIKEINVIEREKSSNFYFLPSYQIILNEKVACGPCFIIGQHWWFSLRLKILAHYTLRNYSFQRVIQSETFLFIFTAIPDPVHVGWKAYLELKNWLYTPTKTVPLSPVIHIGPPESPLHPPKINILNNTIYTCHYHDILQKDLGE